jgi:hypothetical protein
MTEARVNTGNLGDFCPFDSASLGGGDDDDGWFDFVPWNVVLGAFEGPAGDFSFDDAGVGSSPSWWEQAAQEFSERGFEGAGESAGGKMPPGRLPGGARRAVSG